MEKIFFLLLPKGNSPFLTRKKYWQISTYPPFKCKTHRIWPTLKWKSIFLLFLFFILKKFLVWLAKLTPKLSFNLCLTPTVGWRSFIFSMPACRPGGNNTALVGHGCGMPAWRWKWNKIFIFRSPWDLFSAFVFITPTKYVLYIMWNNDRKCIFFHLPRKHVLHK